MIRCIVQLPGRNKMNKKKMVAILGSPNKNGVVDKMLRYAVKAAQGAD